MTLLSLLNYAFPDAEFAYNPLRNAVDASQENIWTVDLDIKKLSRKLINLMYGDGNAHIKVAMEEFMTPPVETNTNILWVKVPKEMLSEYCNNLMDIVDDATVNSLNFQYLNGEWYFGETQGEPK